MHRSRSATRHFTMIRRVVAAAAPLALLFASSPLQGEGPPRPEAQIAAMAKLDYMPGTWSGTGWMLFGDRRVEFRGNEVVQSKLGGVALLVEGSFFSKMGDREVPVHTTLGVISFDPKTAKYHFKSWLATGSTGERELTLKPDGWYWDIESPRGTVRYEMTHTASGEWIETGHRRTAGGESQQFFEMRLRKE